MSKFNFMNSVSLRRPKRNTFDLSFDWKGDALFGALIPVLCKEVVPGDTWKLQDEVLLRFDALISPILHNVNIYIHYFFVPNRLLWDKWEEFITGGPDGTSAPVPPAFIPTIDQFSQGTSFQDYFGVHSLWDYLGNEPVLPDNEQYWTELGVDSLPRVSMFPFKVYSKIWNDYYRDQNFEDEIVLNTEIGGVKTDPAEFDDFDQMYRLKFRAWEKDYFTSALPWTQRGVQMSIPFSADIPVSGAAYLKAFDSQEGAPAVTSAIAVSRGTDQLYYGNSEDLRPGMGRNGQISGAYHMYATPNVGIPTNTQSNDLKWVNSQGSTDGNDWLVLPNEQSDDIPGLSAHVTSQIAPTINDLRAALRIQEWLERNAVGGSRYIEQIFSHFGVRSSDARLQRSEYLGGGKVPVVISEIQQTSASKDTYSDTPLGDLAGHGLGVGTSMKFKRFFEEHGWIMGIMSVMPRSSYSQGIPRQYLRRDKFDYYWPQFAHLGEQPVYTGELALLDEPDSWDKTFGYTPRYSEYKFSPSVVVGSLRTSKSYWHLARYFEGVPELSSQFISTKYEAMNSLNRIFAVENDFPLTVEIWHKIWAKRPMPRYGTPML